MLLQKIKIGLIVITSFMGYVGNAQTFQYHHPIEGVQENWHTISLNEEVLSRISTNFSDLRIYGINEEGDSLEIPYFIEKNKDNVVFTDRRFRILNRSRKGNTYFFTFKLNEPEIVDEINLNFSNRNFNWYLTLEGSQDQKEWFTIEEQYRITSISNDYANYRFTNVNFPPSEYQYYQLRLESEARPRLSSVDLRARDVIPGKYTDYKSKFRTVIDKGQKQSIISVDLEKRLPISKLLFTIQDTIDYLRPIHINYLVDSIKTQTGWLRNYQPLTRSYISSLENNVIEFEAVFTSQLQIIVDNNDNIPLTFSDIEVKGVEHKLTARFDSPSLKYFLVYGKEGLRSPKYDIINFKQKIPANLSAVVLGKMLEKKEEIKKENPLLENQWWLWGILILIVAVLGIVTYAMIKKANTGM